MTSSIVASTEITHLVENVGVRQDVLCIAITDAIASIEGVNPTDLDPLNDAVDVDALAALVHSFDTAGSAEFTYEGNRIVVDDHGHLLVYDIADDRTRRSAGSRVD